MCRYGVVYTLLYAPGPRVRRPNLGAYDGYEPKARRRRGFSSCKLTITLGPRRRGSDLEPGGCRRAGYDKSEVRLLWNVDLKD